MLNLKGYHGHHGLEGYRSFETHNLGSQVPNSVLLAQGDRGRRRRDPRLADGHPAEPARPEPDRARRDGRGRGPAQRELILACGGPRVSNELAKELGYDAGFSKGTYPHHLATFIVRELAARRRRPRAGGG